MAVAMKNRNSVKKNTAPKSIEEKYRCFMCDKFKIKSQFYMDVDPLKKSGVTQICKECAKSIALRQDELGNYHEATKESLQLALSYLNKPFLEKMYEASIKEVADCTNNKLNIWASYIKNISLPRFITLQWKDSDVFIGEGGLVSTPTLSVEDRASLEDSDINTMYKQNQSDAIRLLGYDPFENETDADKPLLYSKLIRYCDASEDANDDEMKISSIVEITKLYAQCEKINSLIANYMQDLTSLKDNIATIKSLESIKKDCMSTALALAKDNGISIKHSNNNSKGANTWTGKVKLLKEMNLREQEVNLFDVGTAEGMLQVANISNAAILKQISLNENDFPEMISEQKKLIDKYKRIAAASKEQARILLRENFDLKELLIDNKIDFEEEELKIQPIESTVVSDEEFLEIEGIDKSILSEKDAENPDAISDIDSIIPLDVSENTASDTSDEDIIDENEVSDDV